MKIVATGDIHYDLIRSQSEHEAFHRVIRSMESEKPDVLVIAGDTVSLGSPKLEECLHHFGSIAPVRLMVFGNHDYWSTDGDTFRHLEIMKERIRKCGFKILDEKPEIIDGIGFAGNCSWYDYSFASMELPPRSSYEKKMFRGHIIWNDLRFVRLGMADSHYTNELIQKLEDEIRILESEVDLIIVVTHHIGFMEMLTTREEFPGWNFCNAFMGSAMLGEMLLMHPKVRYHISGHIHDQKTVKKEHLVSINPGSTYDEKKYISLVI
jgi:predicted phosphodiesterase